MYMEKKHYLLLKKHDITGLKYLCYHFGTESSCFKYKGSGSYWLSHLKKHKNCISTIILDESHDKSDISKSGELYSAMWDVVNSKNFANLIIENAESDASKLHTPEARLKRVESFNNRFLLHGLTDKEKKSRERAIKIMHSPENRKKAIESIRNRHVTGNLTDKQLNVGKKKKERISIYGFTDNELEYHKKISESQMNLTMRERLNDPTWINPNKGKSGIEIHGDGYIHPRLGKKLKEIKGSDYIEPKSNPFKLIINNKEELIFSSESDFIEKTKLTSPMLCKIKRNKLHTIKRQSNSLHNFKNGDVINYIPLTIEEYKKLK